MEIDFNIQSNQLKLHLLSGVSKATMYQRASAKGLVKPGNNNGSRRMYDLEEIREILGPSFDKSNITKKIHIFYNFKGGTGKTTITYHTASTLAMLGYNVLMIDLDAQALLTQMFNIYPDITMLEIAAGDEKLDEAIINIAPGLDLIGSNLNMTKIEFLLTQTTKREEAINRIISPIKSRYDFILIDTNPALSNLNISALLCADHINIICETQPMSYNGLSILLEEIDSLSELLDKKFNYKILANKYDIKTSSSQEVLGALRQNYNNFLYDSIIRKSEDLVISSRNRIPLINFCKQASVAFTDINDFVKELLSLSNVTIKKRNTIKKRELEYV